MAFLNANCSFTRLKIIDAVPASLWQILPDKLRQFAIRDIDESSEERSFGWVCFDDMLDTDWHTAPPEKGEYITFSFRLDTRRVPAAVVKKYLAIAIKEEEARNEAQGKKFIARERRKELKELTMLRLRQRFLPVPAEFNVVWNTQTNVIYFASTQTKMVTMFIEYFVLTFDLHLEPITPYQLATSFLGEQDIALLDSLEPTSFAAE